MSDELQSLVTVLHNRAITELMIVAAEFRRLGEPFMGAIYETRATDLERQRERHLKAISSREKS